VDVAAGMSRLVFPGQVLLVPPAPPPAPPPARRTPPDDMEVVEYQFIKVGEIVIRLISRLEIKCYVIIERKNSY
jgi:hypothetical protein